mgnify:FL=1
MPIRADDAFVDHARAALRAAGVPVALPFPTLRYREDRGVSRRFKLEEGKYMIVHLFAGNTARGLHPDKKRELLAALTTMLPGLRLVISGGVDDKGEALRIAQNIPATVIVGEATLQEMLNLIATSRGAVSVDTGMAHIAAQLGTPLVVVRTCVGRNWWLPGQYGSGAPIAVCERDAICAAGHLARAYPACINAIDMKDVAEKASTL